MAAGLQDPNLHFKESYWSLEAVCKSETIVRLEQKGERVYQVKECPKGGRASQAELRKIVNTTIQSTRCTLLLRAHKMTLFFHCVCPKAVFRPHHITICEVNSLINDKKLQGHKCCWYFIASCRLRLISGITIVPSAKSGHVTWGKRNACFVNLVIRPHL